MCYAIFSSFNTHTDDYSSSEGKQNVNDEVNLLLLFKSSTERQNYYH